MKGVYVCLCILVLVSLYYCPCVLGPMHAPPGLGCLSASVWGPSPAVLLRDPPPLPGALGSLRVCQWLSAVRCAHERVRRVPLGAVRQVPGPRGGRQEAALVSSLSSLALAWGRGKTTLPFLQAGRITYQITPTTPRSNLRIGLFEQA